MVGITTPYRPNAMFGVPWCRRTGGNISLGRATANVGQIRAELAPFRPNELDALLLDFGLKGEFDAFLRA